MTTTQATQRSTWEWLVVAATHSCAANGAFFGAIMVGYLADVLALARRRRVPGSLPD